MLSFNFAPSEPKSWFQHWVKHVNIEPKLKLVIIYHIKFIMKMLCM